MPRAWSPSGVRSGSSPGRARTRASVARLVALQALSAWIRSVPVVMSSCYAKSASLCPDGLLETFRGICPRGILDGYPVPQNFHQGRWVPAGSASSRDSMYLRKLSSSHMLGL